EKVCAVIHCQLAADFGKSQIVANRQTGIEVANLAGNEGITGAEDGAFVERRGGDKMRLTISGPDVAAGIDENLSVVNARTVAIRNSDDYRKRKLLCHFLNLRDSAL